MHTSHASGAHRCAPCLADRCSCTPQRSCTRGPTGLSPLTRPRSHTQGSAGQSPEAGLDHGLSHPLQLHCCVMRQCVWRAAGADVASHACLQISPARACGHATRPQPLYVSPRLRDGAPCLRQAPVGPLEAAKMDCVAARKFQNCLQHTKGDEKLTG